MNTITLTKTTYTKTIERAIQAGGCGLDDLMADGVSLAEALRTLAIAPGYGSDGDYTHAERDLMLRAATMLRAAKGRKQSSRAGAEQ